MWSQWQQLERQVRVEGIARPVSADEAAEVERYFERTSVSLPPHWSGFRIVPTASSSGEVCQVGCTSGMSTCGRGDSWRTEVLYP